MLHFANKVETDTDASIIEKILQGQVDCFEVLIRRYNSVLYKIARSYGFNHQDAEDLIQDTHVAAYLALAQFEGRSAYKTWISKIMVNKCIYKLRSGYYKHVVLADHDFESDSIPMFTMPAVAQPEKTYMNKELSKVLEQSLQHVPVIYRVIFVLREVEGFSIAETSELLNISPMNVKVRLNRARHQLQHQVELHYSKNELYSFNLIYCDGMVEKVFTKIRS